MPRRMRGVPPDRVPCGRGEFLYGEEGGGIGSFWDLAKHLKRKRISAILFSLDIHLRREILQNEQDSDFL